MCHMQSEFTPLWLLHQKQTESLTNISTRQMMNDVQGKVGAKNCFLPDENVELCMRLQLCHV